ncbi:MAG: rhodanese-like domain-containing protein [Bacteroidales bacterium]|jgi:rhodanese-related sulfurtransferase|nr:rhodanese-like domain-containing protein [Bacteroidales bacterium]
MINFSEKPKQQEFHIEGVKHVSAQDAFDALSNNLAIAVDVREEFEVVDKSINIEQLLVLPMSGIADTYKEIPLDKNIILICLVGKRSTKVANLLNNQGYKNVYNLDGGLQEWIDKGLPVVGCEGDCSSGCSCCG